MSFETINKQIDSGSEGKKIVNRVIEILRQGKPENERETQIHLMHELWKINRPGIPIDIENGADLETLAEYWISEGYYSAFRLYITSASFLDKTKNMDEVEKWQSITLEDLNSQFVPVDEDFE